MLPTYVYSWRTIILTFCLEGHLADRLLFLIYAANHMPFEYFEVLTAAYGMFGGGDENSTVFMQKP